MARAPRSSRENPWKAGDDCIGAAGFDEATLHAQFRGAYHAAIMDGALTNCDAIAAVLASRNLRLEVLADTETQLSADLKQLEKRNSELAKTLGRPRHQFSK
jgi:hypothetical protein